MRLVLSLVLSPLVLGLAAAGAVHAQIQPPKNPYAINPMAEALHQALLMPEQEQIGRMSWMRE